MKLRKSPRMPGFDYRGWFAYSLTLVTRTRATIFITDDIVTPCIEAMNRSLESYDFALYAYCFMPGSLASPGFWKRL
ncbi:MAG: hypothetical protein ACRD1T_17150 [Acidimicrobiia bacterium]